MPATAGRQTFRALLGDRRWAELAALGSGCAFGSGSVLLREGDPGRDVLVLLGGRVVVSGRDADGGEVLLALRGPGDLLGELAGCGAGRRGASVQAVDRVSARRLAVSVFHRFLGVHRATAQLTGYLAGKLTETAAQQLALAHRPAGERLAALLVGLLELDDSDVHGVAGPRRIPLTQERLAAVLGLARSTVALELAALRRAGALAPGRRIAVADPNVLAGWPGAGGSGRRDCPASDRHRRRRGAP